MCFKNGKYCSVLPGENNLQSLLNELNVKPEKIIQENIYQLCVFDSLNNDIKSIWFKYMQLLIENCIYTQG